MKNKERHAHQEHGAFWSGYPDSNWRPFYPKNAAHFRGPWLIYMGLRPTLQNGADSKTVSSMLGHYDAGFTLRTYTHATRQIQDEVAEKIEDFMEQVI